MGYLEGSGALELSFQIPTRSCDTGGSWRGKLEVLETENLGKRLEWRDRDET